jgi:hypothetical protein
MRVFRKDFAEESEPLIKHKGNMGTDISSEICDACGKFVQVIKGKMKKHRCLGDEDKQESFK